MPFPVAPLDVTLSENMIITANGNNPLDLTATPAHLTTRPPSPGVSGVYPAMFDLSLFLQSLQPVQQ